MGFQNWVQGKLGLTAQDRQAIMRLFGSFDANKIGTSPANLIQKGYEENVDVYSVIKKIVDTSKSIEWIVERRTSEGWEVQDDTTIHELMANPNPTKNYTWDDIEEQMLVYLLANGNSYLISESSFNSNLIAEVDVLPSPYVCPTSNSNFFMPDIKYQFELGTNKRTFQKDEIEHVKFFNPGYTSVNDSLLGLSAIQVARDVVSVGNSRWDAHANLLQNRGAVGMITDKSNRPMLPEEAAQVQQAWNRDISGSTNSGKIKVTNKDLNYIQMAMSATDLQLVEANVITLRAMCNVFGLDSSLFNDPANKTFNNRKEAEKALYTNAVIPLSDKIAAAHTQFIAKNHYPGGDYRMRQDFSNVEALQSDQKTEAEKDKIVMDGVNVVMNMPISSDAKESLLIDEYDMSEEQAAIIVAPVGSLNPTLETLKSLSPLLANKLVESLSPEEVRELLIK
jgi:HK97 family phage portal protein